MRRLAPILLLAACATPPADVVTPPPVPITAGDSLGALTRPATFVGELPCADCEGITTTIVLHPDGTAHVQDQFRGTRAEGDGTFTRLARWTTTPDRLIITGATAVERQFAREGEHTLRLLDQQGAPITTAANLALRRVAEAATLGAGDYVAEFRYLADAASLTVCSAGIQLPVGADSSFLELERIYGASGVVGGEPLVVRVRMSLEPRPAMEGDALVPTAVVHSVEPIEGTVDCASASLRQQLAGAPWTLVELDGTAVTPPQGGEAPTLMWDPAGPQIAGSAGCNRYTGRGVLRGVALIPAPIAMTRMMCAEPAVMEREARFGTVIGDGGWFTLIADTLRLAHGATLRAKFVRR